MRITIRRTFGSLPEVYPAVWSVPAAAGAPLASDRLSLVQYLQGCAGISMQGPTPTEKPADLPLIAFGAFDQHDARGAGFRRGNLNPEGLWCVAYDFDDAHPDVFAGVLARAKGVSRVGIVHTTWKHGLTHGPTGIAPDATHVSASAHSGVVRARIIMPCIDPEAPGAHDPARACVKPEMWESFWWATARAIGAAHNAYMVGYDPGTPTPDPGSGLDTACRNPERTYYVPCRNMGAPSWAGHFEAWAL